MSGRWLAVAVIVSWLAGSCGQPQLVGYVCPDEGCEEPSPPAPPGPCETYIVPPPSIASGEEELCWVYSLDALGPPGQNVYLTEVEPMSSTSNHHLDVQLVSQAQLPESEVPDGPLEDCRLWNTLRVAPLLATQDGETAWDLSEAPLVMDPSDRLLIIQHYVGPPDELLRLTLKLSCTRERPDTVTQAFAFIREEGEDLSVLPAQTLGLCTSCNFMRDVVVRRMFRRTHLIEAFRVRVGDRLLWESGADSPCRTNAAEPWRCDFDTPEPISARDVLEWECLYVNRGDTPAPIGRGANEDCSLFGYYTQSTGELGEPERCRREALASESNCEAF